MNNYIEILQWVIFTISVISVFALSGKSEKEKKVGWIFTGMARFGGIFVFAYFELYAMVAMNIMYVVLSFRGYKNSEPTDREDLLK